MRQSFCSNTNDIHLFWSQKKPHLFSYLCYILVRKNCPMNPAAMPKFEGCRCWLMEQVDSCIALGLWSLNRSLCSQGTNKTDQQLYSSRRRDYLKLKGFDIPRLFHPLPPVVHMCSSLLEFLWRNLLVPPRLSPCYWMRRRHSGCGKSAH